MIATTHPSPFPYAHSPEKAITLALSLADAERAIHAFASDQVDAVVDADGRAYLLRPAQEHLRQSTNSHAGGRTNPSWADTPAVSAAEAEREFIILSHGRQMPFMGPRFGVAALDGNLGNDSANPAIAIKGQLVNIIGIILGPVFLLYALRAFHVGAI